MYDIWKCYKEKKWKWEFPYEFFMVKTTHNKHVSAYWTHNLYSGYPHNKSKERAIVLLGILLLYHYYLCQKCKLLVKEWNHLIKPLVLTVMMHFIVLLIYIVFSCVVYGWNWKYFTRMINVFWSVRSFILGCAYNDNAHVVLIEIF